MWVETQRKALVNLAQVSLVHVQPPFKDDDDYTLVADNVVLFEGTKEECGAALAKLRERLANQPPVADLDSLAFELFGE